MSKEVTKREAQSMVAVLGASLAVGVVHVMALVHAKNQFDGGERAFYTGLIVLQTLGLTAITIGQGAAIYLSKTVEDKPARPVIGTRDFDVRL